MVQETSFVTISNRIQEDLDRIVGEIAQIGGVDALILMGGFGRGEGSVVTIRDRTIPLNDYDLMIVTEKAEDIHSEQKKIEFITDTVVPGMNSVREHCDTLETMVPDSDWPLPKYRELLFLM